MGPIVNRPTKNVVRLAVVIHISAFRQAQGYQLTLQNMHLTPEHPAIQRALPAGLGLRRDAKPVALGRRQILEDGRLRASKIPSRATRRPSSLISPAATPRGPCGGASAESCISMIRLGPGTGCMNTRWRMPINTSVPAANGEPSRNDYVQRTASQFDLDALLSLCNSAGQLCPSDIVGRFLAQSTTHRFRTVGAAGCQRIRSTCRKLSTP